MESVFDRSKKITHHIYNPVLSSGVTLIFYLHKNQPCNKMKNKNTPDCKEHTRL